MGLLHPACPPGAEKRYVSRWEVTRAQKALNPESLAHLLKDKGLFYKHCAAHGLPIPKLYAMVLPGRPGWCIDGAAPTRLEEWTEHLGQVVPDEFVIKPVTGAISQGFDIFTRNSGGFIDSAGRQYTASGLASRLCEGAGGSGWVVQERLRSHPDVERLSGSEYLQGLRIVTLIDKRGDCRIILGCMRTIIDQSISDNAIINMTGSTELPVNLADGRAGPGVQARGDGLGPHSYTHHPKTGLPLAGFEVPMWHEACELAQKAAMTLAAIRTIGWDVAATKDGVFLLEGNIWWDNGKKHEGFRQVVEQMWKEV